MLCLLRVSPLRHAAGWFVRLTTRRLTFNSGPVAGKTMVVQSTSTGGDLGTNHFDLAIPGGGVGLFDGCKTQFGGLGGQQYGGVSSRSECDSFPAALKPGCYWRFDWFLNADNPTFTFKQVSCPAELTARTGCKRNDDGNFPAASSPGASGGSSSSSSSTKVTTTSTTSIKPSTTSTSTPASQTTSSGGSCTAQKWGQCGGNGYTGCKTCVSGSTCQYSNDWYSQCL